MCFRTQGLYTCGKCPECLTKRRNDWILRLSQFAEDYKCFSALLTYNNDCVPLTKSGEMTLCKRDIQLFMKRLRKIYGKQKIWYYISAEYSPEKLRPHYHCLFFNIDKIGDQVLSRQEIKKTLQKTWMKGFVGSHSDFLKDNAQIAYTVNYLLNLYDWDDSDLREKPFRLLSNGMAMHYKNESDIHSNYGWYNVRTGEFLSDNPSLDDHSHHDWVFVSPVDFINGEMHVKDDFDIIDTVKVQQTKYNPRTKKTTLGAIQTFNMPRVWRVNALSDSDREILNLIKKYKSVKKQQEYLEMYSDYDLDHDFPMWKQIKYHKWSNRKKSKKDKLISNPFGVDNLD